MDEFRSVNEKQAIDLMGLPYVKIPRYTLDLLKSPATRQLGQLHLLLFDICFFADGYASLNGLGLAAYALIVITNVDNLIRFMLQKKMADIHPLVTIFGVIIGLSLFGFMGVIFGPLLISVFMLCFNMFKKEYLQSKSDL